HFSKGAMDAYKQGVKLGEGLGAQVIEKGLHSLCDGKSKVTGQVLKFAKCDDAHADEEYCKFLATGKTGADMLCHMAKDKAQHWYGIAAGCIKEPAAKQQDCLSVMVQEMKDTGDMVVAAGHAMG
ncbi:unnamed protein product, partial [Oppiella nova]